MRYSYHWRQVKASRRRNEAAAGYSKTRRGHIEGDLSFPADEAAWSQRIEADR